MTSLPAWRQLQLCDPALVTVRLSIGLDGPRGLLTWGLALHEGTEEELVGMEVTHSPLGRSHLDQHTRALAQELRRIMATLSPF